MDDPLYTRFYLVYQVRFDFLLYLFIFLVDCLDFL